MEKELFKIGEVTKTLGLSRRILLNYEAVGLLTPAYTDAESGYRYYSADNIVHIRLIRALQNLGLSLKEIGAYFKDASYLSAEIDRLVLLRNQLDQYIAQLRLRQATTDALEMQKVTLPELTACCFDYSHLGLAERTRKLREVYIATVKHYTMDFENKMCANVPVSDGESGTFLIPVAVGSKGKNIRTFPQTTAVCVYYRGPYENFPTVHDGLLQYARQHDLTPYGYFRHVYMEGPPTHGDNKSAYITQIALPINFSRTAADTYGGMFEKCNYQADMCIAFLPSRRYTEEDDSSGGKHEKDI